MSSAAATILLALFTWRLAVQTHNLAGQAEADVSANWRPVVISGDAAVFALTDGSAEASTFTLTCNLQNLGPGPALNAILSLADGERKDLGGVLLPPIPPDQKFGHMFSNLPIELLGISPSMFFVTLECVDIGGRQQKTELFYAYERDDAVSRLQAEPRGMRLHPAATDINKPPRPPFKSNRFGNWWRRRRTARRWKAARKRSADAQASRAVGD